MQLTLDNIEVRYGDYIAVNALSLALQKGEIACLVGPSGCGKTTLQRAIAGFESLSAGSIELAGRKVSHRRFSIAPERRKVGMVFQDFALFPHLTVAQNIRFGLASLPQTRQRQRVKDMLALIDLSALAERYPHELSGGQQQRVALARAMAPEPDILLLDEAFSSLDAGLRESLAGEVRSLLKNRGTTAILATHHQHEAFAIADVIGIMRHGKLLQWDSPYQIYHRPNHRFVAQFIGEGVLIPAQVDDRGALISGLGVLEKHTQRQRGGGYSVLVRPDDINYHPGSPTHYEIVDKLFRGAENLYTLKLADGHVVLCETPSHVNLSIGEQLPIATDFRHLVVFEA